MRSIITILFFLLVIPICPLSAQNTENAQVKGQLLQAGEGEVPVSFANVVLINQGDSSQVAGTISDESGSFSLDNIPYGNYMLKTFFIGYENQEVPLEINADNAKLDLGKIRMVSGDTELETVFVTAEKELVTQTESGIVVNADASLTQSGGTVADILRNVPSVTVDVDGNVTLRGGNPNVLINGRNSGLAGNGRSATLDQIPASAVESIEIVNNPGAKYDADGVGGVIDIKLKKEANQGSNLIVEAGAGNAQQYNGALRLNHRNKNYNLFGSYDVRHRRRNGEGFADRQNFNSDGSTDYLVQYRDIVSDQITHNFRLGGDYQISPKTNLGVELLYGIEDESDDEILTSEFLDENRMLEEISLRDNTETEDNQVWEYALIFERKFKKRGQSLKASLTNTNRDEVENNQFSTNSFSADFTALNASPEQQRSSNDTRTRNFISQIDYTHPIAKNGKLETGYKGIIRNLDQQFVLEDFNENESEWLHDEVQSNDFDYEEQIHAYYTSYRHRFGKKWTLSGGIRLEQVWIDAKSSDGNDFDRDYFNYFPTLRLGFKPTDNDSYRISYSKRIDRPRFRELNPFVDLSDTLNVRTGNPNLNPELIHSFELAYSKDWDKVTFSPSIYYRYTEDVVQRITRPSEENEDVLIRSPENTGTSTAYGLELIATWQISKWWDINSSYSLYRIAFNGSSEDTDLVNENTTWSAKMIQNFKLPGKIRFQVTGNYRAPSAIAQGERIRVYWIDMGMRKGFMDDKLKLAITFSDVFNTLKWGFESSGETFSQLRTFKRQTQILRLNATYTIGNQFHVKSKKGRGNYRRRRW